MKMSYIFLVVLAVMAIGFGVSMKKNSPQETRVDVTTKPFGTVFTDHMFIMDWNEQVGWHNTRIEAYKPFSCDPASLHMHYGQEIFEGMKAFHVAGKGYALFRPKEHLERMNQSARIMCMPEIDVKLILSWLKKLVTADKKWIPMHKGTALYIRPTMIATEATINLKPASQYTFFIILSPVGALYKEGFNPIPVLVTEKYTRTSAGGVGQAKTGGNYAAAMRAQIEAKQEGCSQVLWLDPTERTSVDEVGSMNIFFVFEDEIVTPALTGTILPGITRKSVLALGSKLGLRMTERRISIDEVIAGIKSGAIKEVFGTGTAAVIAPIGSLKYKGNTYWVNDGKTGPITQRIYDMITGIQYGTQSDENSWLEFI